MSITVKETGAALGARIDGIDPTKELDGRMHRTTVINGL